MSMDDVRKNLGSAISIFAKALEASVNTTTEKPKVPQLGYVDELMSYFPLAKVDEKAGTIDQYLFDLRKTVVDNYESGNYQVSYFYAHLIFMSYVYYSVDLAFKVMPDKVKDQYSLINSYSGVDKPTIDNKENVYAFSKIPEKEIFKVFYAIGMDVHYIQQLAAYVKERDNFAHATGKGNIDNKTLESNIGAIKRNMDAIYKLFQPRIKDNYVTFLLDNYSSPYTEVVEKIADYIMNEEFSMNDIDYLCNLGLSNIRNENAEFKKNYRHIRKIHCAFIEYCIENYATNEPNSFSTLRTQSYLYYKYRDKADDYVENELGISAYSCIKDAGEFPVYDCPECGHEQLAYDAEADKYHCFHCSEDFDGESLIHCSECHTITYKNEMELCPNCIEHKMSD